MDGQLNLANNTTGCAPNQIIFQAVWNQTNARWEWSVPFGVCGPSFDGEISCNNLAAWLGSWRVAGDPDWAGADNMTLDSGQCPEVGPFNLNFSTGNPIFNVPNPLLAADIASIIFTV